MGEFAEGVYESLETAGLTRQLRSLPLDARFEVIDPTQRYTVVSYDHKHLYRAVIADNLQPQLMP